MTSRIAKSLCRIILTSVVHAAYRFETHRVEHIPKTGAALLLSNHVSFFDWLFIGVAVERDVRFVMHEAHWKSFFFRWFFELYGVIPIAPKKDNPARLIQAMNTIDGALADGELVVLFPEGTMTPDGELGTLRPGVERIVARRPVPVIPVGLRGLWGSMFSRKDGEPMTKWPRRFRARVEVEAGVPIAPDELTLARIEASLRALSRARASRAPCRAHHRSRRAPQRPPDRASDPGAGRLLEA